MIKNIFTHWRTSGPGVGTIVTGIVALIAGIHDGTITQSMAVLSVMGICGGIGLLYSQDYTQGDKAHAESQAQIAQLQLRSNIVPNAIETGDTSLLRSTPITAAPVADPPKTP